MTTTTQKLIPVLRFPEFEGQWEEKKLGDVSRFSKGKGISKKDIEAEGKNECIRYGELYTTYNEVIEIITSKTNIELSESILSKQNDVIIPSSGETQLDIATASCVLKNGVILGGDLNIIRSSINGVFLSYLLNNSKKKDIAKLAQGNSVVHLYNKQLATLKINLPESIEQQKIASFLTAIDSRLQALGKKKSALEQYKKGVMQKIFTQEIRFKDEDGKDFPAWEKKKLGEVCVINPRTNNLPASFIYVDLESVKKGKLERENFVLKSEAPSRAQRLLKNEDILFQMVRPYQRNNFFFSKKGSQYVASTGYAQLRTKNISQFIYQLVHNDQFVNDVMNRCTGTSYPAINSSDLGQIRILLPSIKEQTHIANYLTALDKKIELVNEQIEKTKAYKKGLLQNMFV